MTYEARTIEDCLEILTELKPVGSFKIDSSDTVILNSIARQVYKGTALTDRQYELIKQKLISYTDQFSENGVDNLDTALDTLRLPLREIDRSKTIEIVDSVHFTRPSDGKNRYIKVRFPFNKKIIAILDSIAHSYRKQYEHQRGSNEHYFNLTESIVYRIVTEFKDRNFKIDPELLKFYDKIVEIKNSPEQHLKCIVDSNVYNIPDDIKSQHSVSKLIDRKRRYGITNFDTVSMPGLIGEIVNRTSTEFLAKPSKYSLQQTVEALYELDRFPLVVVLEERNADTQLLEFWNETKNIIPSEAQSVLFRQEGETEFNQLIKNKNLNNWVDSNTKIVYINSNKLPKLMLTADWQPIAAVSYVGHCNRFVDAYIKDTCDLIVFREEELSPMRKYSSYYQW